MGTVRFTLESDQAKAVQGFLKLVDAQKAADRGFKGMTNSGRGADKAISSVGRRMTSMVSLLAGGAGLTSMILNLKTAFAKFSQGSIAFNDEITQLLSLGDNVDKIKEIRGQVLGYSNAWGIARKEVADAMFDLQSGTANLSEATRGELLESAVMLKKVYGAELQVALRNLTKTYQIFGDELNDVSSIQQKLAFLARDGYLNFEEMSQLLPEVLPAAKAMGDTFNDVIAALVVATQKGGRTETTFTGVRNVFLNLAEAEKKGIHLTGNFVEKLEQLNKVADKNTLLEMFGVRSISTAKNLLDSTRQLRDTLARLDADLPDVGAQLRKELEDPIRRTVEQLKTLQTQAANQYTDPSFHHFQVVQRDAQSLSNQWRRQGNFLATTLPNGGINAIATGANAAAGMSDPVGTGLIQNLIKVDRYNAQNEYTSSLSGGGQASQELLRQTIIAETRERQKAIAALREENRARGRNAHVE